MWKRTYSKVFKDLSKEAVWKVWTDIDSWPLWHNDLEACSLAGPFTEGNAFTLKPKGMKPFKIKLVDVQQGHQFTDCTPFFGAKMYDTHELEETQAGLRLTNRLVVTGPLQWVWVKLVAQHVADSVPEEMEALVNRVRTITP